jgi:flagellar FliL protein
VSAEPVNDEVEEIEPIRSRRLSKKVLIILGVVLTLMIAGGIGAWLLLGKGEKDPEHGSGAIAEEGAGTVFVEMPAMIVNQRSTDGSARLIKIRLTLVPGRAEQAPAITARMPLIIDSFQPFLRELRPEDLAGSAAVFRIKEELLLRANGVTGRGTVREVLVQDLIQQ